MRPSRPVNPRASRTASRVLSVPLLVKRHWGSPKRLARLLRDHHEILPRLGEMGTMSDPLADRFDDPRVGMADHVDAEPVVEVDVLVAVGVPDTAALAPVDENREGAPLRCRDA